MKSRILLPAGWLLVGLAIGAGLGSSMRRDTGLSETPVAAGQPQRWRKQGERPAALGTRTAAGDRSAAPAGRQGRFHGHWQRAARELARLRQPERRIQTVRLFQQWTEEDPLAALAYARGMGAAGQEARMAVFQCWANQDPAAAAQAWEQEIAGMGSSALTGGGEPLSAEGHATASAIARAWAAYDPNAAFAWAESLEAFAGDAVKAVVGEAAKSDPQQALRWAEALSPAALHAAHGEIVREWGAARFEEATAWIRSRPLAEQAGLLVQAFSGLAEERPEAAARQWDTLPDGEARFRAAAALMRSWGGQDPQAAAGWLQAQESEQTRRDGTQLLVSAWVFQDPKQAWQWIEQLPQGSTYDRAVRSYVQSANSSPAELMELAATIGDEAERGQSIAQIVQRWAQTQPEEAQEYLRSFSTAEAPR